MKGVEYFEGKKKIGNELGERWKEEEVLRFGIERRKGKEEENKGRKKKEIRKKIIRRIEGKKRIIKFVLV